MAKSLHEQVSDILAKVIDLSNDEALKIIESECGNNEELKKEVHELYYQVREDENGSITKEDLDSSQSTRHVGQNFTTVGSRVFGNITKFLFENRRNRLILIIVFLVALFGAGWIVGNLIRDSILESAREQKVTLLNTTHEILDRWIYFEKKKIESLAMNPELVNMTKQIDSLENMDDTYELLRKSNVAVEATKWVRNVAKWGNYGAVSILSNSSPKDLIASTLMDSTGISYNFNTDIGEMIYPYYLRARNGETVFSPPMNDYDLLTSFAISINPMVWINYFCPIYDENRVVVGVLVGSYLAKDEFSDILQISKHGASSETYAFNDQGLMLSASRFTKELRKTYLLNFDSTAQTLYKVSLKDPEVDITKGKEPDKSTAALSYTKIVKKALNHLEMQDSVYSGSIMTPYRDYRGIEVIGAYVWLPEYGFGLITEEDYDDALSSLVYFDYTFAILFVFILVLSFFLYNSNVRIARFGSRMKDFEQLGQYFLKEKIGEGGFGYVYKAEHHFLKTPVAIKLLKKEFIGTDMLNRFEKEVIITSSLSHPNTVKVYDYGTSKSGQFYYVMEYLNGISIDKLIRLEELIPLGRVIHVLLHTCLSLEEAHKKGLIHRDIKPGNIMLCNQGGAYDFIKVLDFGLVKNVDATISQQTQLNRIGGTPMFMAPERLRDPYHTDQRVDIYAVGALGLYILSGQYIVELISQKMLAGQETLEGEFSYQLVQRDDIPESLENLLKECIHFDPKKRPLSISVLVKQLGALQKQFPWSREEAQSWWKKYDIYS